MPHLTTRTCLFPSDRNMHKSPLLTSCCPKRLTSLISSLSLPLYLCLGISFHSCYDWKTFWDIKKTLYFICLPHCPFCLPIIQLVFWFCYQAAVASRCLWFFFFLKRLNSSEQVECFQRSSDVKLWSEKRTEKEMWKENRLAPSP